MERKKPRKIYSWLQADCQKKDISNETKCNGKTGVRGETEKTPVTDLNPGFSYKSATFQ